MLTLGQGEGDGDGNPYQTDIYVKYLQISVTYLWQYCTLSVTGLSISAQYLHDVHRYFADM